MAVTGGNSNTSDVNLSFKAVRDPKTKVVFSTEGLYIRGTGNGELRADIRKNDASTLVSVIYKFWAVLELHGLSPGHEGSP